MCSYVSMLLCGVRFSLSDLINTSEDTNGYENMLEATLSNHIQFSIHQSQMALLIIPY
jgi:hypothetical protein